MAIIEVDFTGVTSGAGFLEPGMYQAQVEKVEQRDGANYPGLKWTWTSIERDTYGQQADDFTSLAPKALWKFKGILEAFGAEIPQSMLRFDTDRLIGKKAYIRVVNEPWTGSDGEEHPSSKVDRVMKIPAAVQPNGNEERAQKAKATADFEPLPVQPADDFEFGDETKIPF
jgi:hypothetical protein